MKLFEPVAIILGIAALYWVIADIFDPEPNCTIETSVSDTTTIYQYKPNSDCEKIINSNS